LVPQSPPVIADGWAIELLVQTFFELYRRARRGEIPAHVPLPSFQEYVCRERANECLPEYHVAEGYWRARLAVPVEMPCFYGHRAPRQSTSKKRVVVELGMQLTERLKALARQDGVFVKSLEATMTNVFGALLFAYAYRTSGLTRLALGVAFHNRASEEQKQLVGLLMEVLPFVVTVSPEEPFLALVQRVHQDASNALQHRQYSVGNPVQAPVYDMFLSLIRTIQLEEGQGPARRVFPGHGETNLSLTVLDAASSDNLQLSFDVKSSLLDSVGGEAMVGHFCTLLEAAVTHPNQPIASLPLVAETERHRLLVEWNATEADYPRDQCVHELFEAQAARTPDAIAVVHEDAQLTYAQLNAKANRLAHHLRTLGVMPDARVAIGLERSREFVLAELANPQMWRGLCTA
jgi:non-ribosomal peptide synthetase component F